MEEFDKLFKGLKFKDQEKRRRKENKRKERKRKRECFNRNVLRVYKICVKCPFNDEPLPEFFSYPPAEEIPEQLIDVESVSQLNKKDAPHIQGLRNVFLIGTARSRFERAP